MRRFAQTAAIVGLSLVQVVGMSMSGVASTSRHAAVSTKQAHSAQPVQRRVRGEKPKPRPKLGSAQQIVQTESREELLGAKGLDLVKFDWKRILPGWKIRFLPAKKGYLAITFREERRIDVYVRADRSPIGIAHDIGHELGHAIDVTYLNDASRSSILKVRSLEADTPWWACDACTDLKTGAGDFAETFALVVAPHYKFYSELGQEPSTEQQQQIVTVVNSAIQGA
jgi:hypothetical protein